MKNKLLVAFFLLAYSCGTQSRDSHQSVDKRENNDGQSLIEYPRMSDGYTPSESLIESIEDGNNEITWFVEKFGVNILRAIDPHTGLNMLELAYDAGNEEVADAIVSILAQRR